MPKWLIVLAILAFTLQLGGLFYWNALEVHRDNLTWDYAIFAQAAWMLTHGFWNPFISTANIFFWTNHDEWLMWPISQFTRWIPFSVLAPGIQDLATVGSDIVAWLWMAEILARRSLSSTWRTLLASVGLLFLVATPWVFWADGFLFHFHALEGLWLISAGWAFWRGSARAGWIFAALLALTSQVSVTYLVPLGMLVFFWRQRRAGIFLIVGGIAIYAAEMLAVGSLGWLGR
ncbi:MAG: hypothetical protein OWS74_08170, partial [Firmicutes bacterium]|nr:hypothetical protein [Bacillota bacterium]